MTLRLRDQLVVTVVLLTGALTSASLFMLKKTVQAEVRKQVATGADASARIMRAVQREREERLARTAGLLSELPTLKAIMATQHRSTVQDGSEPFWKLSGGDMFLLATPNGNLLAKHFVRQEWPDDVTETLLQRALANGESSSWWFHDGHLYWVFLSPLRAGAQDESRDLGVMVLGYETGPRLVEELANASGSEIILSAGRQIIASTLSTAATAQLQSELDRPSPPESAVLESDGKGYTEERVILQTSDPAVSCWVLLPLNTWRAFLSRVNSTLLILGIAALAIGGVLLSIIARAMTRPLENVVAGIRALVAGNYSYNINASGSLEIEHLARSFAFMRTALLEAQRNRLAAERAAVLDRTASSISHDLRHYLSAVVANAEFLCEEDLSRADREEVYCEIKMATEQMLELIESLRELSREQHALRPQKSDLGKCIRHAIDAVQSRRECRDIAVVFEASGDLCGVFDPMKLGRLFVNLILNACEAVARRQGKVTIVCRADEEEFTVRITDDGPGIPEEIRETLFDPFVSLGKPNGTGLGLAIAQKIVHDHNGSIVIESTGGQGTTVLVHLPRCLNAPLQQVEEEVQGSL